MNKYRVWGFLFPNTTRIEKIVTAGSRPEAVAIMRSIFGWRLSYIQADPVLSEALG